MDKNKINIDDIEIKPVEPIPVRVKNKLEYVKEEKKVEIKLGIADYFNIIKAYLINRSLEELGMEEKFNINLTLLTVLLIMITLIIIMLLQ